MADTDAPAGAGTDQAGDAGRAFQNQMLGAGEAMRASGQKAAENGSAIGLKMIDQAESNTHEAFAAMRRAAQAKDLSEVMRVQSEYLREQSARSVAQAREIGELILQFGRDAVAPLKGGGSGS